MRDEVKDVPVQEDDDGLPYVLVEDILDTFSVYGEDFLLDGQPVPYLLDHYRQRFVSCFPLIPDLITISVSVSQCGDCT